jgi:general stress protein YciG
MSVHPTECRCADCIHELQHDSDRAQAQTLALLDLLSAQRVELRRIQTSFLGALEPHADDVSLSALRASICRTIDRLCSRFTPWIGPEQPVTAPTKKPRGFARLSPDERKRVASKGGSTSQQKGTAHKFTSEQAAEAGIKGGAFWKNDKSHLSAIGRKGGKAKLGYRKRQKPQEAPE